MAAAKPRLSVILTPPAVDDLHDIWRWNAERYSLSHADEYLHYLQKCIDDLAQGYSRGRVVHARPDLRYVLIRRKRRGHGHVAVFRFDDKVVHILHFFHTAQDWPSKLTGESSDD